MSRAADEQYSRDQLLAVAKVTHQQLRAWQKIGFVSEQETYTWSDLVAVQALAKLSRASFGPKRIQKAIGEIQSKLSGVKNPLSELNVIVERGRLHVLVDGQHMDASSGQLLLNFNAQQISRLLSFPAEKTARLDSEREKRRLEEAAKWFQRGLELEQNPLTAGDAISAYEKAIQLDPGCVGAFINLGTICFQAKNWKQAERYYKQAVEIEPEYALGHFNLANLYDERGDVAKAYTHYSAAVRIAPNYADAHYNLALLCQRTGQTMRAVGHWRAYLKLDPSSNWAEVARRELTKLRESAVVKNDAGSRMGS